MYARPPAMTGLERPPSSLLGIMSLSHREGKPSGGTVSASFGPDVRTPLRSGPRHCGQSAAAMRGASRSGRSVRGFMAARKEYAGGAEFTLFVSAIRLGNKNKFERKNKRLA